MAWDFRPGMRVVCVANFNRVPLDGETLPRRGQVYTIRDIERGVPEQGVSADLLFLRLEEIVNPLVDYGWGEIEASFSAVNFRPIDERRIDCLRAHLAPRPRVEEVA